MRHTHHFRGNRKIYDGAIRCSHVVMGRLDPAKFKPAASDKKPGDRSPEEQTAHLHFERDTEKGKFGYGVLEWCVEAEGYLEVSIEPIAEGCVSP
jgi:hypothetical protein